MNTPPPELSPADLAAALAAGWGLAVHDLHYLPVGFGGHHWRALDERGQPRFVTVHDLDAPVQAAPDPDSAFAALERAFAVAVALRDPAVGTALPFVTAPVRGAGGSVVRRLGPRFAVSLQPWVDGRAGTFGAPRDASERRLLAELVGRLHAATAALAGAGLTLPAREDFALQAREPLEAALADLGHPWPSGPFAEPARALLLARRGALERRLRAYDARSRPLALDDTRWVVTHGEPHPGNVLRSADGNRHLVDWDTVLLAPPERDLHHILRSPLRGEDLVAVRAYLASAGSSRVDVHTLQHYRDRWTLTDVSTAITHIRAPHERTPDVRTAFGALRSGLAG